MKSLRSVVILFIFFLAGCAQINALTGGKDDETAPAIDSAKTYPFNGQTNFDGDEVKIRFDEYIVLNKPNDNIIITPRPGIAPDISAHNKTLTIRFIEPLQDNTTYTISFNRAVADLTEKNDSVFQYVFSTGDYIDSLSLSGTIKDGFTNSPSENFLVALYPASTEASFDSIPYLYKPVYIGQTDKAGNFKLNYMKEGVFYIYAFDDNNKNLLLDADEAVAFLPSRSVLINSDTEPVKMKSFKQQSSEVEITKVTYEAPGRLQLIFANPADSFFISTSMPLLQEETGAKDSMVYWLSQKPTPKMRFVTVMNSVTDTLKPIYKSGTETQRIVNVTTNVTEGKILPGESLRLTLNEPIRIDGIDPGKITLMRKDSSFIVPEFEVENVRTLVLKNPADKGLVIKFDSAAFTSIYGNVNSVAQTIAFENHPASYYGSLVVNTDSVFAAPGIVYVLDAKGLPVDTAVYAAVMKFSQLLPGDYQLQLVLDENGDGKWTSGSLKDNRIPEKVIYFNEAITIKSKWEKEVDWILTGQQ